MENIKSDLLVGIARENITPALGTELLGYPLPLRSAERVMDPLSATAIAIKQNDETVILISVDLCVVNAVVATRIRKNIEAETGIPWQKVIIAAIHTHSGPITSGSTGWGAANTNFIEDILIPKSQAAAKRALDALEPATMGIGTADTLTGINRREIDADGNVILGQNPNGPYDPTMTLVCFKKQSGEYIGSIVHFAAHPTAAARNKAFTRDWPGLIIDKMEELTDAPCLFFNGAEGDVGPRLSNGDTTGGEEYVIEAGTIAAADIEKAYKSIKSYDSPKLTVACENVFLPYVTPPTREFTYARIKEFEENPDTIEGVRASLYDQLNRVKEYYDNDKELPLGIDYAQTIVALGEFAIVPAPFETFCLISLSLKEKSPYKHTILMGLANGSFSYLPTEDQLPFGGYEVDSFRNAGLMGLADDTDKRFVNANVEIMKKIHG